MRDVAHVEYGSGDPHARRAVDYRVLDAFVFYRRDRAVLCSPGEVEAIRANLTAASSAVEAGAGGAASVASCCARRALQPQSVAACLCIVAGRILSRMGTKSRETI